MRASIRRTMSASIIRCLRETFPTALCLIILSLLCGSALNAQLNYTTSWLGNTFGGPSKWVQCGVQAAYVHPDGRVFTNSYWDEGGREAGVYQNGDALVNPGYTHGWGMFGGRAVTGNNTYLYLGVRVDSGGGSLVDPNTWPAKGTYWYGISRRPMSNVRTGAPFSGGKGGSGGTLTGSFLIVNSVAEGVDASVTGLAANDSRLYVSNGYKNEIRVYDANSMAFISSFAVPRPADLVVDARNTLWIVQKADAYNPARIVHYTTGGTQLPEQITAVKDPRGIAIDRQGRLMVAENGPAQQILIFDISAAPSLNTTFGTQGGIASGIPGEVGPLKFSAPVGVGMDAAGNLYVASSGAGADIRAFSPSGQMIWRVLGLVFDETAVADPDTDGRDVYTQHEHYTMDYSKGAGQEWTYKGSTIDHIKYPTDPRLAFPHERTSPVQVRNIQGRKYLYMGASQHFVIYRMQNEIAVPSAMFATRDLTPAVPGFQTPRGHWFWRDLNGDGNFQNSEFLDADGGYDFDVWGWEVDKNGDVWRAGEKSGLWKFPLQGIDQAGNPIYTRGSAVSFGMPAPITTLMRVRYFSDTDTMYLTGYTNTRPKTGTEWGSVGTEVVRYDNWSKGNRTPRWRIALPYPNPSNYGHVKSWAIAGQRLFAGMLNSQGLGETPNAHNLYVYDTGTGAFLGEMLPGPEVGRSIGWLDITDSLSAIQRSNGEYVVFMEEVMWEKVVLYRMGGTPPTPPPTSTRSVSITAPTAGATVNGTIQLSANASASAGIAGVQFKVDGVNAGAEVTGSPYVINWNSTTVPNGAHSITAVVRDTAGATTTSAAVSITVNNQAPPQAVALYRINAGGSAYTDPSGQVWSADQLYSGGTAYPTSKTISGTNTPALYQTERWGSAFSYRFTVPNGSYSVKLKFAEIYFSQPGQRVFNVAINGQTVLSNFDIVGQAGGPAIALDKPFAVNVTTGQIAIAFSAVKDNAKINAIEIAPASAIAVSVSPGAVTLGAGKVQQFTPTVSGSSNNGIAWSLSPQIGSITATGMYTAPAVVSSTQTITVLARCAADLSKSASATITLSPSGGFAPIRINAGGPAYADSQNRLWAADSNFGGGNPYVGNSAISGTSDAALYRTERWGASFQYQFAVPNGAYAVNLKFAEIYFTQPGQRVFNVAVNGQPVLSNFDPLAQAGGRNIAVDRGFVAFVTNGQILIDFRAVVDNAKISAIEILPAASLVRVNSGGNAYTDPSGRVWSADSGFSGGNAYQVSNAITGTATPALYQTERWGSTFNYTFNVPNGTAIVALKFAEIYFQQPGKRIFNVAVNGQPVLVNFDIVAQAGGPNKALDRMILVPVTTGQVKLSFTSVADSAKISGIEILTVQ